MTPLALSFLNPALLWFAALAAIPLAIYLFSRQRYRTMPWAAMEFVLRALKENRRRLRIENLLLLLVRMAVVVLLALALARPVGEALGALDPFADRRRHVAIAIDTSYSMGYREGAQTSFERARKAARDLAEALLKRGDRFALMAFGPEPRFLYADPVFVDDATKARVLADIAELEPSAGAGDAGQALRALAGYLPRFRAGTAEAAVTKQVFIVTDMQKSAFATEQGTLRDPEMRRAAQDLEKQEAEVVFIDCGAEDPSNLAVTALANPDEIAGVDMPVRLVATVKSFAPQASSDASLDFVVDEHVQSSKPLELEPGEEKEVELYATLPEKGTHRVQVVLRTDGLPLDNARYLAIEAREAVDVIVVDGERKPRFPESETDFLVAALAPGEDSRVGRENLIRPRVVFDPTFQDQELEKAQVVVLANVIALSDDQVERLEAFVRRGGGLLIFTGGQVDRALWNEKLWREGKGLLPAPLGPATVMPEGQDSERFFVLAADTFAHPVLRPFASADTRPLFSDARFWGYTRLDLRDGAGGEDPNVTVLARFEPRQATAAGEAAAAAREASARPDGAGSSAGKRGDPALVEKQFGRGRVLLFASTADDEWNLLFARHAYLILWQKAVTALADAGAARRNLLVGDPFEQVVPAAEYSTQILLTTPAQDPIEKTLEKIEGETDRFRLAHAETQRPGFYEIRWTAGAEAGASAGAGASAERVDYFAVNVEAAEEADLAKIDAKELARLLPELKAKVETDRALERLVRSPDKGGEGGRNELWRYALYAVLGLLVTESALACWFGRKNR